MLLLSGCWVVRKYPNKPFAYANKINLTIENVPSDEKKLIESRLSTQIDDSSKPVAKGKFLHKILTYPAFDTTSVNASMSSMRTTMWYLAYFSPRVTYKLDTVKKGSQLRVTTTYNVIAGKRTLIDTFAYLLADTALQKLALQTKKESPLQPNTPITKIAVQTENARLVELFRNKGYYKFTPDDLRVTGDTTIEALTTVTDDPFEQLALLAQANEKRNKPTIKLGMVLNSDSTRFKRYYIDSIYILPDYVPGDSYLDSSLNRQTVGNINLRYHSPLFFYKLFPGRVAFKKGALYNQEDYYNTINNFYKVGVWESPSIDIIEKADTNLLDIVIKMIPVKRYGFEGGFEVSYSANSSATNVISSTNSGNLLGVAANLSLLDRNLWHRAVRMTHALRAGIELNTSQKNSNGSLINSNELSYSNSMFIPKIAWPLSKILPINLKRKLLNKQTFVNVNLAQINRIEFFNQQGLNLAYGYKFSKRVSATNVFRLFNLDFRRIYNTTERFDQTLDSFPFLRYSFNTALVTGMSFSRVYTYTNQKHPKRSNVTRFNIEESGLTWAALIKNFAGNNKENFASKYLKEYIKVDMEYVHTWSYVRSAVAIRFFGGLGIPLTKSDTTLPFFKQYYGGGPNSMRGWPVRGIGVGGQPLSPYNTRNFNDRTGDIQLEGNIEYRFNYLRRPLFNVVSLKGALFADIGNIWNVKNTKSDGSADTTQFPFFAKQSNKFTNFYKQLGVSAGTGIRLDFNYFVLRFDLGFRFKRPDITRNDGWQNPFSGPGDIISHIFSTTGDNKRWRYENFNFTIGVDYPF